VQLFPGPGAYLSEASLPTSMTLRSI